MTLESYGDAEEKTNFIIKYPKTLSDDVFEKMGWALISKTEYEDAEGPADAGRMCIKEGYLRFSEWCQDHNVPVDDSVSDIDVSSSSLWDEEKVKSFLADVI